MPNYIITAKSSHCNRLSVPMLSSTANFNVFALCKSKGSVTLRACEQITPNPIDPYVGVFSFHRTPPILGPSLQDAGLSGAGSAEERQTPQHEIPGCSLIRQIIPSFLSHPLQILQGLTHAVPNCPSPYLLIVASQAFQHIVL